MDFEIDDLIINRDAVEWIWQQQRYGMTEAETEGT